jgi:hypothetical protein
MSSFTKAQLLVMNSSPQLGFNWIKNIENISSTEKAKIYPTGDAGLASGRIYIALPECKELTNEMKSQYNIF